MSGPHVFEDGRLGLICAAPDSSWRDRLIAIRTFANGAITDLFLPRECTKADFDLARGGGFYVHLWVAPPPDGSMSAVQFAARTVDDVRRLLGSGALELNIELASDPPLAAMIRDSVLAIRTKLPARRIRLNIAPRKFLFLPVDLLQNDPNLYVVQQTYFGNMDSRYSEADALDDLIAIGVPRYKASVCYAAVCSVGGVTGSQRVNLVPLGMVPRRGVIFVDNLLADGGLI